MEQSALCDRSQVITCRYGAVFPGLLEGTDTGCQSLTLAEIRSLKKRPLLCLIVCVKLYGSCLILQPKETDRW